MYSHVFISSMLGLHKYQNKNSSPLIHTGLVFFLKAPNTFTNRSMGSFFNYYQYRNHNSKSWTLSHTGPLKPQLLFVNTATALCPALSSGVNLCAIQTANSVTEPQKGLKSRECVYRLLSVFTKLRATTWHWGVAQRLHTRVDWHQGAAAFFKTENNQLWVKSINGFTL